MTAAVRTRDASRVLANVISVSTKRYGRDTVRTVTIRCPFCGKRHTHGWPLGDCEPGSRRPHCAQLGLPDYYISAPTPATRKAA